MALELLKYGFKCLPGLAQDGSCVYRRMVETAGNVEKIFVKVKNGKIVGQIERNIANISDDLNLSRTNFLRQGGEKVKSYRYITQRVDDGYRYTISQEYKNLSNRLTCEKIVFGNNGQIYNAGTSIDYGNFVHEAYNRTMPSGAVQRGITFHQRDLLSSNTAGFSPQYDYSLPTKFDSIANVKKRGWFEAYNA